ncbi:MAG: 50S ribosomal protein L28 [Clostridiaceae bacterium]|nr:50S ribosomal protein L28 [Clostridiaceae bacterium]
MAKCYICSKETKFGNQVSHSNRKTKRIWKPNIRKVRAVIDGVSMSINVCAKCLRSNKVKRSV